jgi:asparagine synthase (glutamine-hydrolysing)
LPAGSKPQFQDEREFIDEFLAWPNVTIEYVAPENNGPFDGIEDASNFYAIQLPHSRHFLSDALHERAVQRGADVILAGNAGEAGPTAWGRGYYLELASRMKWWTLVRELAKASAIQHASLVRIFGRDILYFLSSSPFSEAIILLSPDFVRTFGDAPDTNLRWPDHRNDQLALIRTNMRAHAFSCGTCEGQIRLAFPFRDKRVLEFCLSAPGHLKVHNGYSRYLIRQALDGVLPKKIQWRTTKCAFSPDYPRRYRAQLGKAHNFVAAIRRSDPVRSIVDVDRLRYLLEQPTLRQGRMAALVIIPASIYLICFLRQFAEFQP